MNVEKNHIYYYISPQKYARFIFICYSFSIIMWSCSTLGIQWLWLSSKAHSRSFNDTFIPCHFVVTLMRTHVYVNKPMMKLVLSYVTSLEVTEPIEDVKWGLTVFGSASIELSSEDSLSWTSIVSSVHHSFCLLVTVSENQPCPFSAMFFRVSLGLFKSVSIS